MRFRYAQSLGLLSICLGDEVAHIGKGYAGRGPGLNNPDHQTVPLQGPIPRGLYKISVQPHPRFAPPALRLVPTEGTEMFGRSGFWVHGDNNRMDFSASNGCPVLDRSVRVCMAHLIRYGFTTLEVVR